MKKGGCRTNEKVVYASVPLLFHYILLFQNLIYRCPFTISRHIYAKNSGYSRRNIDFTNHALCLDSFPDPSPSCHKDRGNRSVEISFNSRRSIAMKMIKTFINEVNNITTFFSTETN